MKKLNVIFALALACTVAAPGSYADFPLRHVPHAATLWWVIFNNPDACITNPGAAEQCGPADVVGVDFLASIAAGDPNPALISPNVAAGVAQIYAAGAVSDPRNGRIRFATSIYRSPAAEPLAMSGPQSIDTLGLQRAFDNPDAEIHLVVRDHGRVDRDNLVAQLTNFIEPSCSDPNLLFEAGPRLCKDLHAAVFAPGETGQDAMFRLADGQLLSNAKAFLFRQGDVVQTVIETRIPDRRKFLRY